MFSLHLFLDFLCGLAEYIGSVGEDTCRKSTSQLDYPSSFMTLWVKCLKKYFFMSYLSLIF